MDVHYNQKTHQPIMFNEKVEEHTIYQGFKENSVKCDTPASLDH